jgi:hypothetical protein
MRVCSVVRSGCLVGILDTFYRSSGFKFAFTAAVPDEKSRVAFDFVDFRIDPSLSAMAQSRKPRDQQQRFLRCCRAFQSPAPRPVTQDCDPSHRKGEASRANLSECCFFNGLKSLFLRRQFQMKKAVSLLILLISAAVLALPAMAQQQDNHATTNNPLAVLLQSKGILSASEVAMINQASSPEDANARLARLLVEKGLINSQEYTATVTPAAMTPASLDSPKARLSDAVLHTTTVSQASTATSSTPPAPSGPPVIPAVNPTRVLPIDIPKQGGMIPDIHLGSGANVKLYGFYKASAISDTASSGGATFGSQDWPLPLLLGDTAAATPDHNPQVHLKARSFRMGMQTEWVPKNSGFTITARVEGDFEGDYTDVSNRNISSVRSNQFSLRFAWMRLDHTIGGLPWFAEFGQDWSLLGSSTLPAIFETTGLGVGMGSLYERIPQFKTGVQFHAGDLKIQPEIALVLSAQGSSALTTDQHLRFGDAVGAESDQPGVEARIVFQKPLNKNWKGVAPAQLIFSGHQHRPSTRQKLAACFCPVPLPSSTAPLYPTSGSQPQPQSLEPQTAPRLRDPARSSSYSPPASRWAMRRTFTRPRFSCPHPG